MAAMARMAAMAADASAWKRRAVSSAILAAIVFGGLGIVFAVGAFAPAARETVTIGGPFTLTSNTGETVTDADLKGAPFAVFFGFTHCPEVCPTTLWEMSEALKGLGPDGDALKMLFITVDPARDTPEVMARYLQSFDPRIVALTGSEAQIDAVAKHYRAYWNRVPTDDGGYTMDHTASVFLMDAEGTFQGTIAYEEQADVRLEKLKRLVAGS